MLVEVKELLDGPISPGNLFMDVPLRVNNPHGVG